MEGLPEEVILHVFELLMPCDWVVLSLVNKFFFRLTQDNILWEKLIPPEWKSEAASLLAQANSTAFTTPLAETTTSTTTQPLAETIPTQISKWFSDLKVSFSQQTQQPQQQQQQQQQQPLQQLQRQEYSWLVEGIIATDTQDGYVFSWKRVYFSWVKLEAKNYNYTQNSSLPIWLSDRPQWIDNSCFPPGQIFTSAEVKGKPFQHYLNVVALGPLRCGKSTFVKKVTKTTSSPNFDEYQPTIGIEFWVAYLAVRDSGKLAKLVVWDTSGDPRFDSITKSYLRGVHCVLLCFDVSNRNSFDAMRTTFFDSIKNNASKCCVKVVGLKAELPCVISDEELQEFVCSDEWILPSWSLVSMKEDQNVDFLLVEVGIAAVKALEQEKPETKKALSLPSALPCYVPGRKGWNILVKQEQQQKPPKEGCCVM